jgi:DNA-binding MarR family transcriptional regulator
MPKTAEKPPAEAENFGNQDQVLLGVLSAVDRDSQISQRTISRELGVALGLANACLKRCVRKGWIKIQAVPRRRYVYYLTPQGFAEKSRLAGQYLSASFDFFRRARQQMSELMEECVRQGWSSVALAGISDLAEVGTICAHNYPIKLVAILDATRAGERFCGLPVHATIAECGPVDAVILTSLTAPGEMFETAKEQMPPGRVLAPHLLRVAMAKSATSEAPPMAAE